MLFSEAILEKTAGSDKIMKIDIRQRVETLGVPKSQGLNVIHNFSGADWGRKVRWNFEEDMGADVSFVR